jgi:endoglucanase
MRLVAAAAAAALFYADPDSNAARQAKAWEQQGRTADAAVMRKLADVPQAFWFTPGSPRQVRKAVKRTVDAAGRQVPVLVAYNSRGCGNHDYGRWINGFARGIGRHRAWVIVEPDALAFGCVRHVKRAVKRLRRLPRARVYVDAGHSKWQPAKTMRRRLERVGARRFALNVSNFRGTEELIEYGKKIGGRFVIDTSRNGQGPNGTEWCNPPGRGLGARPTTRTGHEQVDAFLWIKRPGESDGPCHGGPPAGGWWPEYALGLSQRAVPALSPGRTGAGARPRAAAGHRPRLGGPVPAAP